MQGKSLKELIDLSGGYYNFRDRDLKSDIFGWNADQAWNAFEDREISELIFDVFDLIHEFDLYKSEDNCKDAYLEAKAEFKKKWFSNRGVRVQRVIDNAVDELRQELYKTYGIEG